MATLKQYPASLCFSSDIADIVFGTTDEKGILVLELICAGNRVNVLEETMYADMEQNITVFDLPDMVEPYARQHLQLTLECRFTDTLGTVSISPVTVLYGNVDVDTTAADFTQNRFLSILCGEKLTAMGRAERLHAYDCSNVTVLADVQLPSGQYNTLSAELNAMDADGSVSHFDVSPDNVAAVIGLVGGKLLAYAIEAGNRRQQFRVVEDRVPPAPSLMFINSFGCEEFIHCVGTHKKESKYDRRKTSIRGRMRNYLITEDRQFNANTGWLNEAMADWADDLFRSDSVYLWVSGRPGREVVLSDSKSEITNEDDNMPAFEFTYSYSQRIHNVMQSGRVGRIFDNTFDHTFD